ncbi:MAG: DUF3467 domain-containing protein [Deltaproteobacteria bacterium]|jgi:hypothetical protein|nr:DUF3467 domain-containing protein [Deltaproteobacteria bacterium]
MSESKPEAKPMSIHVHLEENRVAGDYVNMARIFHNQTEFVMDAMFLPPQSNTAKVMSRLVMSPIHAKHLMRALSQNISMYEQKFGEIQLAPPGSPSGPGGILH